MRELLQGARALVLDGGFATELERRGLDIAGPLWSARVLIDAPDAIEQLHYDYYAAGADCVISASYQASYEGFRAIAIPHDEATACFIRSVDLASAARERFARAHPEPKRPLLVAASVGPYGAMRHDGSEYHGNYGVVRDELRRFHEERLAVLAATGADVIACETLPSLQEASVLTELLGDHTDAEAWISFTSPDGIHTAHGEPLAKCARAIDDVANVVAVGVNCLHPTHVQSALGNLRRGTDKPLVAYPNSGEVWDARSRRWVGAASNTTLAELAPAWLEAGARLIGGCCRTGPADIAGLAAAIR